MPDFTDAVAADNAATARAIERDRWYDQMSEKAARSHKGLLNGRNFLWDVMRYHDEGTDSDFHKRYDNTFKGCVGSEEWKDKQFCPDCGFRRWTCKCGKEGSDG